MAPLHYDGDSAPLCYDGNTVPLCCDSDMAPLRCGGDLALLRYDGNSAPLCYNGNTVPLRCDSDMAPSRYDGDTALLCYNSDLAPLHYNGDSAPEPTTPTWCCSNTALRRNTALWWYDTDMAPAAAIQRCGGTTPMQRYDTNTAQHGAAAIQHRRVDAATRYRPRGQLGEADSDDESAIATATRRCTLPLSRTSVVAAAAVDRGRGRGRGGRGGVGRGGGRGGRGGHGRGRGGRGSCVVIVVSGLSCRRRCVVTSLKHRRSIVNGVPAEVVVVAYKVVVVVRPCATSNSKTVTPWTTQQDGPIPIDHGIGEMPYPDCGMTPIDKDTTEDADNDNDGDGDNDGDNDNGRATRQLGWRALLYIVVYR
ncbi:hypothetical protein EDB89DRAFT_1903328 [Lactarius sanguifluus]|nr:hypothetical protein EDB89DRAFT_1903328 [Lactarius sanguifluus]